MRRNVRRSASITAFVDRADARCVHDASYFRAECSSCVVLVVRGGSWLFFFLLDLSHSAIFFYEAAAIRSDSSMRPSIHPLDREIYLELQEYVFR